MANPHFVARKSIFTAALAVGLLSYANDAFSRRAEGTLPKRSDGWVTGLWMVSIVCSLGCTTLFGMTGVGYIWSLRAQADWLEFSEETKSRLDRWEKSRWHWTCMFWYSVVLDVMFASAPLALLLGLFVFMWAETKGPQAAVATAVAVIVVIQCGFRVFMMFTCLWKSEDPTRRGEEPPDDVTDPKPFVYAGPPPNQSIVNQPNQDTFYQHYLANVNSSGRVVGGMF